MEITSCYYCHSGQHSFYAEENGFSLFKCCECGLLFVKNRPDDKQISQAQKQGKHSGEKLIDLTGEFIPEKTSLYLEVLTDLFKGDTGHIKTWLDVGCGHGEFIAAIQKYSANKIAARGTDPNLRKQKSARSRGLDVSYFDLDTHAETYDVISLLNVYSHLPNPENFLESLKRLLNPGGELLLETGDTAGLSAENHYKPFYLPDHLSFASEKIVVGILERLGFEILSINKYPFMRLSFKGVVRELLKIFLPQYKSGIRYYLKWPLYANTDMYIRARLKT